MGWTDYDQHARTRDRDDLWGQVRRTVRGQPVGPEQIEMIVSAIAQGLELGPDDVLLDLACGNGALTAQLHPLCAASLGVDMSPYLIGVAQERFASASHRFIEQDAAAYAEAAPDPGRFTKVLCYGSLSYFEDGAVRRLLRALNARFPSVHRVMLGNLPDPAKADRFYPAGSSPNMREPRSDIGVWRGAAELAQLAGSGWKLERSTMPCGFFAAHYRFDAILVRAPC